MTRSKSSQRWLREQHADPFTRQARAEGWRGRAEIHNPHASAQETILAVEFHQLVNGPAPGSWSQYAATRVGDDGLVIASDRLLIDAIAGVRFIEGDFHDEAVLNALLEGLGEGADLVMSDMAPNMSGVTAVDQPASMALAELAHDLAVRVLKPGGAFVTKMFQGEGSDSFTRALKSDFTGVRIRKPEASRDRSREVYIVATGRQL